MRGKTCKLEKGLRRKECLYGALDLGSNTCRLLIARASGEAYQVIDSYSKIIRLGEGLRASGVLSPVAMERAIDALSECAAKVKKYDLDDFRGVATAACRIAKNRNQFLSQVAYETNLSLSVISEEEEAYLALRGCEPLFIENRPYILAFDIGGCSTEVIWASLDEKRAFSIIDILSMPLGVVSIIDACGGDPALFFEEVCERIHGYLKFFSEKNNIPTTLASNKVQVIGSSGTTTTLSALSQGLTFYDRSRVDGSLLQWDDIQNITKEILKLCPRERANIPCIGPERSDLVLAGFGILQGVCRTWAFEGMTVADRGVRDGLLREMIGRKI